MGKERRKSSRKKHKRLRRKSRRDSKTLKCIELRDTNIEFDSQRMNLRKMPYQWRDVENSYSVHENTNGSNIVGNVVAGRRINNGRGAYSKESGSTLKHSRRLRSFEE